jgi:uncharacterized protein
MMVARHRSSGGFQPSEFLIIEDSEDLNVVMTRPFPPYTYTPGVTPHPVSDPSGHSWGASPSPASRLDPERPWTCAEYVHGIDLFLAGFYWEAHEAWESVWHAVGRTGSVAAYLKGLIKLAAAGVKRREGNAIGLRRHATRAVELFTEVRESLETDEVGGQSLQALLAFAQSLATFDEPIAPLPDGRPIVFWPGALVRPSDSDGCAH